ncbi:MAG: hypothetical protein EOO00_00725 [Chitinophagaceae bacterium]|nr:MAG: hypothetical protein EOO00_00725 [Chitinophagaceae bacterium]
MILKNLAIVLSIILSGSCNNESNSSTEVKDTTLAETKAEVKPVIPSGCYAQIAKRDTSMLQFEQKDSSINGTLSYKLFEKDRNDGTFQADIEGSIITGWYIFKSEGVVSVRQVSWKINGEELWPGEGEVTQRNDTTIFVQPDKLNYDGSRPFKKVACVI